MVSKLQLVVSLVGGSAPALSSDLEAVRPSSYGEEDLQLQLALAMSKEEHDEDTRRRKGDELKLQMALEESRKSTDHDVRLLHFITFITSVNGCSVLECNKSAVNTHCAVSQKLDLCEMSAQCHQDRPVTNSFCHRGLRYSYSTAN